MCGCLLKAPRTRSTSSHAYMDSKSPEARARRRCRRRGVRDLRARLVRAAEAVHRPAGRRGAGGILGCHRHDTGNDDDRRPGHDGAADDPATGRWRHDDDNDRSAHHDDHHDDPATRSRRAPPVSARVARQGGHWRRVLDRARGRLPDHPVREPGRLERAGPPCDPEPVRARRRPGRLSPRRVLRPR